MKKLKKIVSLMTVIALCALLPGFNTLTVQAEEGPNTFYIKYVSDSRATDWRYVKASTWEDDTYHRELYYFNQEVKDGDIVIVEGNNSTPIKIPAHLSNLTLVGNTSAVVHTNGVDDCFVHKNNVSAINGDVKNAYVFNNSGVNFNNNVENLYVSDSSGLHASIAVVGTVNHVVGSDDYKTYYEIYNVAANTLRIDEGRLTTAAENYSTSPTSTPAQNQQPSNSGEYDDVPKTGESNLIFYLLGVVALCLIGRAYVKKAM